MRFLTRSLIGLFLLSLTAGLLTWAGHIVYSAVSDRLNDDGFQREVQERVFAVHVVPYQAQTITPVLTAFGQVRSRRILEVRAPSSGTITHLADQFVDGGRVSEGMTLLQVNKVEAEATLARSRADLSEAEAESRDADRAHDIALEELAAAQEQMRLLQAALERQQDLRSRGVGTEAAIEDAELALSSARQSMLSQRRALAQAEARLALAGTGIDRNRIDVAEAERGLADTSLSAAFSGTLGEVSVVKGGLVSNNERVAILTDPDQLEVSFRISAAQYARLLNIQGQLLNAQVQASLDVTGGNLTATGRITRESASVGEQQTGRMLFAQLEAAPEFRPGDFVAVQVKEPALDNVAELPASAVGPQGTVLVIGSDDRLAEVRVNLLRRQGDLVLIRAADLDGLEIVAARTPLLGAGIKVRAIRPGNEAAGQSSDQSANGTDG